ncbi:MAG: hypothetical protein ACXAAH_11510 [Promethearchaeota archaeon]|jgi:hypothetical protein
MSTYNPNNKTTYWFLDMWNMVLEGLDANSWKDSIGRNFDAFVAWKDIKLILAVLKCFDFPTCEEFQRHPIKTTGELSRDHLSYALILLLYSGHKHHFFEIADKLKWKFNHKHSQRGMYLWVKSHYGRGWRTLFYAAKIPEISVIRLWNWSVRKWAGVKPERSQDEWDLDITRNRTERQIIAGEKVFPAYALHNFAWQLKVMPDTPAKKVLQWITRPMAGRHNYVVRHLLGDKNIDLNLVNSYRAMTASRWTTTMDELNDRHLEERDPATIVENNLDRDYMLGVVYNLGVIDLMK